MPVDPVALSFKRRAAAHTLLARTDADALAARARAKSPAELAYFLSQTDPETGELLIPADLPVKERERRAEHARKAYFLALQAKSVEARRAKANAKKGAA